MIWTKWKTTTTAEYEESADLDSPGDARDPQPNEAGREQGERGEQDGDVDGDADDNIASDEHPFENYRRKRDYNDQAYVLARRVLASENWTEERETWFEDEFFKASVSCTPLEGTCNEFTLRGVGHRC